jgi:hypothetical protein
MNTDKIMNWLGLGQAIAVSAVTYYTTANQDGSLDLHNPIFWLGAAVAVFSAAKGWFANKQSTAPVTPPADAPKV